ncbi:MAG: hypothetical protein KJ843_24895 [Alphaproteobacteria bacterium]|nr:hypothetical protein [Alphaproteobacteria bacterium]
MIELSQDSTNAGLAAAEILLGDSVSEMLGCRDVGKIVEFFHNKYIAGEININENSCSVVVDLLQLSADFSHAELMLLAGASAGQAYFGAKNIISLFPPESRSIADTLRSYYLGDAADAPSGVLQRNILESLLGKPERYCNAVSRIAWAYEQMLWVGALMTGDRHAVRKLAYSSDLHFYSELARLSQEERDERLVMLIAEIPRQE